ncbi:MAG: YciI family protein [Akkermansiaceae bacterium]|nr:YciI family protein [Armatimonadota bacterium]
MNYMLLIYQEEEAPGQTEDVHGECVKTCEGLVDRLWASGQYVAAGILQPTSHATSVRLRQGNRLVTDGPFAETHEQLAGYLLVEANDLDEAVAIAAQHPVAKTGTVEVRPLREIPFLTSSATTANSNK